MLEARDVRKYFSGVRALENVTMNVSPGEVVGMVGPNGSGKSTLLEILCGRIRPDGGTVLVDGRRVGGIFDGPNGVPVFRTHQRPRVFPSHSVAENVYLGRWAVNGDSGSACGAPLRGPAACGARLAADLSVGEKRSLNLAWLWARIDSVRYFLLDEPCAGGDETYIRDLIQFVAGARAKNKGVLWVEHNPQILSEHTDRAITLLAGRSHVGISSVSGPRVERSAHGMSEVRGSGLAGVGLTIWRNHTEILQNLSLQVRSGEVTGLLGPNGVGKTSLLLALYGHPDCRVTKGVVEEGGKTLAQGDMSERIRRGIHLLPQEGGIFKSLTVAEFLHSSVEVACQAELEGSRIDEIVEILPHLRRILNRRCGVLSGGERRIAGMARIVALGPRFALLDEPSAGLDREARKAIGAVIRNMVASGTGIVIAEQDREFATEISDEVVELEGSRTS